MFFSRFWAAGKPAHERAPRAGLDLGERPKEEEEEGRKEGAERKNRTTT